MKTQRSSRTTKYSFKLGRSTIHITLRRFHTQSQRRSTKRHQVTIPLYGSYAYKEINLRKQRTSRPKARQQHSYLIKAYVPLLLVLIGGVGVGVSGAVLLGNNRSLAPVKTYITTADTSKRATNQIPYTLPAAIPNHITIPSVGVNADITSVGQASDGSIEMPPILDQITGWYKYSPTPGQLGPAIIIGHVDNYQGISVFWRLRDVKAGDKIYIARADGSIAAFIVTELQQFEQANFPTSQVYGNLDYAGLRLITCGGSFDTTTASYSQNTVVFAKLVRN